MKNFMLSTMEYRGYRALITYDKEDATMIGEVIGINDSLNFHGDSVQELENSFHQSIDNYIDLCQEIGKKPEKEYKGNFNIRITPELHRQLSLEAATRHMTLNRYIGNILESR